MWRPFAKKRSSGEQKESSESTLDTVLDLQRRIKSIELELEEQHDFLRRLAGRRAKETNVPLEKNTRGGGLLPDEEIEPGTTGRGLPPAKLELWRKAKTAMRVKPDESA